MDHDSTPDFLRIDASRSSPSPSGAVADPYLLALVRKEQEAYDAMSEVDWLVVFPEAKKQWGESVKWKLKFDVFRRKLALSLCEQDLQRISSEVAADLTVPPDLMAVETEKRSVGVLGVMDWHRDELDKLYRDIRRLGMIGKPPRQGMLSESEIEQARKFDCLKLFGIERPGHVRCFYHDDGGKPNLYVRRTHAYCFVCNKGWNAIGVLMKRDHLSFPAAVRALLA